ncbi:MAG: hypothetical protein Sapg2KO_43760 [Saprospiraceae bacterium]
MSKLFYSALLCLCILSSVDVSATTYYLDATNGANNQDGLTPGTAWKDFFKIRALNGGTGPVAGDILLFKYGEQWENARFIITDNGSPGNPIVYGAYGTPSDGLPVISSVATYNGATYYNVPYPDATNAGNWTATAEPNIWTLPLPSSPGRLFLDGQESLRAHTLGGVGQVDNEGATGIWFYDATQQLLHLFATQNPANEFTTFRGSIGFYSLLLELSEHVVIENLDLRGATGAALWINASTDIVVQNCKLGESGGSGLLISDSNNTKITSERVTVRDNIFDSKFEFFYGLGSERGCGDGVRLSEGASYCEVYSNTFINWAHNAIELLASNPNDAGVNNNRFYDNQISAPDIPYAHPFGADGLLGKCQENEFFRNNIENCRTTSQVNGNNNWVHHNIIRGMRRSPSKVTPTAHAFALSVYGPGLVSENNRFDHNLIIDTDESAFVLEGFGLPNPTQNHSIRNNIMISTGLAPLDNTLQAGIGILIHDNGGGVGANTFQNNLIFNTTELASTVYFKDSQTYFSIEDFNEQDGVDGNTISDNLEENPRFTDFDNQDYYPRRNSPLIDAGVNTGLSLDYAQNARLQADAPDIGPFETPYRSVSAEPLPVLGTKAFISLTLMLLFIGLVAMNRL